MRKLSGFCLSGLAMAAACAGWAADEPVAAPVGAKIPMHLRVAQLVRADAGAFLPPPAEPVEEEPVTARTAETLELERMTVLGKKIVIPPAIREAPLEKFFRTGTLWATKDGRLKLWMKGDQGLMFTFAW